jgi:hypothetical protein
MDSASMQRALNYLFICCTASDAKARFKAMSKIRMRQRFKVKQWC